VGKLVVKVNGQWMDVEFSGGVTPVIKPVLK